MLECRFYQRLRRNSFVFVQHFRVKRAGIYSDSNRNFFRLRFFHNFFDVIFRTDVARVDSKSRDSLLDRFKRKLIIEMNIGYERHVDLFDYIMKIFRRVHIRNCKPNNINAGVLQLLNLFDRRLGVRGFCICHRLHGNRRIAADWHISNKNFASLFSHFYHLETILS